MSLLALRLGQRVGTDNLRIRSAERTGSNVLVSRASRAGAFTGRGYAPNGNPSTGLDSDSTKAWVTFRRDTYEFAEAMGPPPTPWPSNEIWFRKAGIAGDLVVVM
jgi:hypothetical protein